jgi:hypothetical protein
VAVRRTRWLAEFALLLLTVLGIAGMHTLGHFGSAGHLSAHVTSAPGDVGPHLVSLTGAVDRVVTTPLKRVDVTGALASPDSPIPTPTAVCLAVLIAGIVLLVAARRRTERIASPAAAPFRLVVPIVGRGPPLHASIGLHLAVHSVRRH